MTDGVLPRGVAGQICQPRDLLPLPANMRAGDRVGAGVQIHYVCGLADNFHGATFGLLKNLHARIILMRGPGLVRHKIKLPFLV